MSTDPIVDPGRRARPAFPPRGGCPELGHPVVVLERDSAVGGMGKTITVGTYAVDYGPHTFHIRETEESRAIHEAITPFFGDDPLILTRGTRVLLRGKEYVYPLEMLQVLTGVSPLLSARIIFDYVDGDDRSRRSRRPSTRTRSRSGASRNLGRTLYDLCFGIYSERVWGLPTSQISSKQAQRVAKLNLKNVILRTLGIKARSRPPTSPSTCIRGRASACSSRTWRRRCGSNGNGDPCSSRRRCGSSATAIGSRASCYAQNGARRRSTADGVLSTLPLPALVEHDHAGAAAAGGRSTRRSCAIAA